MGPHGIRYQTDRMIHAWKRRRLAGRVNQIYNEIINTWDQQEFVERFRVFWNPFPTIESHKFLDLDTWLREAVFRYLLLEIPSDRHLSVLDIGAGTGYFLVVCRAMGHEVMGLDVADDALYNECFKFFDLPRVEHRIEPQQKLPELSRSFDIITAFMTAFNEKADGDPWPADAWEFLLDDLCDRMCPEGRLIIKFNLNRRTNEFYGDETRQSLRTHAGFRTRFFLDYALLTVK